MVANNQTVCRHSTLYQMALASNPLRTNLLMAWHGTGLGFDIPSSYTLANTGSVNFTTTDHPVFAGQKCAYAPANHGLYITDANAPLSGIETGNDFTYCFLFSVANVSVANLIGGKSDVGKREWTVYYNAGNGVAATIGNGVDTTTLAAVGDYGAGDRTGVLTNNEWYLGFLGFDNDAAANGQLQITGAKMTTQAAMNTTTSVNLSGPRGTGTSEFAPLRYNGVAPATVRNAAFCALWNRLLSVAEMNEILALLRAGQDPF